MNNNIDEENIFSTEWDKFKERIHHEEKYRKKGFLFSFLIGLFLLLCGWYFIYLEGRFTS